jgi:putative ABC transport system permease protein
MFRTQVRLALRNLYRQRTYTVINLSGLVFGLAGAFLLLLYISTELRYDRFQEHLDQLYRINTKSISHGLTYSSGPYVLTTTLRQDLPGDYVLARTFELYQSAIRKQEDLIEEEAIFSADPEIFQMLSFEVLGGKLENFDGSPQAAVISQSVARRYFGKENPVGKSLTLVNNGDAYEIEIVALIKDLPQYSSFRPGLLISHQITIKQLDKLIISSSARPFGTDFYTNSWMMYLFFQTYVLVPEGQTLSPITNILESYQGTHYNEQLDIKFQLQAYADIYFGSEHIAAHKGGGNRKIVLIYAAVALLLLLTAASNYILLSITALRKRTREMGLKIILGGSRKHLFRQILLETLIFSLMGMIIALTVSELALPALSEVLFGKQLTIDYWRDWPFTCLVLLVTVLLGMGSGSLLASRVLTGKTMELLASHKSKGRRGIRFTKAVTLVQLAITLTLLICTGSIFAQLRFFAGADLGFDLENVISIGIQDEQLKERSQTLKDRIASIPGVESVSGSMWAPPTFNQMNMSLHLQDRPEEELLVEGLMVDHNIVQTLGLELTMGRDFDPEMGYEEGRLILNEKAVQALEIEGQVLGTTTNFGTIIGVVRDFHIHSFHSSVPPMIIQYMPPGIKNILVKSQPGQITEVREEIRKIWAELNGDMEFHFTYLKEARAGLYMQESRFAGILTLFSGLNLLISLLGIFGMARLNTEHRTREVGIRKVLGAESSQVLYHFVYEYVLLVFLAALPSLPAAYLLMRKWLSNFAYHGRISVQVFVLSILFSMLVVGLTVAWQVFRTASSNPVDAIRYE